MYYSMQRNDKVPFIVCLSLFLQIRWKVDYHLITRSPFSPWRRLGLRSLMVAFDQAKLKNQPAERPAVWFLPVCGVRCVGGWLRPWQSGELTTLFIRSLVPRAQQRRGKRKKATLTGVQPVKGPFKVYQTVPSPSSGQPAGWLADWLG